MRYYIFFVLLASILYSSCSTCEEEAPLIAETRSPSVNSFEKAFYVAGEEVMLITPRGDSIQLISEGVRREESIEGDWSFCPGGTPHQIVDGIEHVSQYHIFSDTSDLSVKFSINESIEIGEEESSTWDERNVTIIFDSNGIERSYKFSEFLETQTSIEDSIKNQLTPNFVMDTMLNGKSFQEVFWFEKETLAQSPYFIFYNEENGIIGLKDERDEFYSFERN